MIVKDAYVINAENVKSGTKYKPSAVTDYDSQSSKVSAAFTILSPSLQKVKHRRRPQRSMKKSRKPKMAVETAWCDYLSNPNYGITSFDSCPGRW